MKRTLIIATALLLMSNAMGQNSTQRQRLEQHVYTLAADSLQGRRAGSPDAHRAANYITRQWRAMGLKPLWNNDYRMPFELSGKSEYNNLIAIIEGNDPVLKNEFIVIGGHYDHLGVRKGKIYNGADDNASGTACVTEVARQLLARQGELKRSVIICAFDAEEMGLHGSTALAKKMEELNLLGRVKLMMSVDMVGWLKQSGSLTLEGTGTLLNSDQLTDTKSLGIPIKITSKRFETSPFGATDTEPFAKKGVPTLAVTTGLKSPYHKPEDDADLIDYKGLDLVTDYMAALTLRAANHQGTLASGKLSPKHSSNPSPFNLGLSLGFNSAWLRFPEAAFSGKSLIGGEAGLALQCNFSKHFSLHADVLYTYTRSPYPDPSDIYHSSLRLHQQSVTVPLMLRYYAGDYYASFYLAFGGYYSYGFDNAFRTTSTTHPATAAAIASGNGQHCTAHQYGITWGFGFDIGKQWEFGFTAGYQLNRFTAGYQLNPLFESTNMPRTFNTFSSCKLTYYLF